MGLGRHQLCLLAFLARPGSLMVTPPDSIAKSLIKRGLLRSVDGGRGTEIAPDGLRALADAMESGDLRKAMKAAARDHRCRLSPAPGAR